jgi:streptomycin 6-kinase
LIAYPACGKTLPMQSPNSDIMQIPNSLTERIDLVHGERGRQWLEILPALIVQCREHWSLELEKPFDNLSYNLVMPGRNWQGVDVVLKLGVPCPELLTEASALSLFGGEGAVRLIDHDVSRGMLLLERAMPGTPLYKLQADPEATRTAARLMRRLWREPPAGHSFPSLAVWFQAFDCLRSGFDGGSGPFPEELIARAERTFSELNTSSEQSVILHGDLHHENILSSIRSGWMAIDPKGICGDPGYEVGSFMLNQLPVGSSKVVLRDVLSRRLSVFSEELQIKRERLAGWAFCHAVLSAAWDFEESAEWSGAIHLAQMLEQL